MIFMNCPKRCAATVGNVITHDAKVVPISAYTFLNGADKYANSVLQRMSGTPSRTFGPTSPRAFRRIQLDRQLGSLTIAGSTVG